MQARRVQLELIGWLQAAVAFSGFPVQQLESVLDFQSTGLSGRHFTDLASLRELCSRSVIWSWSSWDFASSKLHESQEIVKKAIRDAEVLQQTIRTCPPLAMKLMLLFLEHFFMHGILEEGLQEANQVHVTFNKVKAWLLYEALPQEDPEEVLAGWDLAGTEAKVFNHYKNLWRAVYSRDAAQRDGEADAPDFIAMAIEENRQGRKGRSETFYKMCPQAEPAELVSVLEAKGATLVEGAMPTKMRLIGNSLSVYWQARGLAELLGAAFMTSSGQESAGRFTDFLPRTSRQKEAWRNSSKELDIACRACPTREDWRWPHSCLGSWASALPLVRAETRRALRKSGAEAAVSKFLQRHDAVIHFRCFPHFNSSDMYPLAAFSLYKFVPPSLAAGGLRFIIIAGALGEPCAAAAAALGSFLQRQHSGAEVLKKFNGSAPEGLLSEDLAGDGSDEEFDFALQVFAPVLFRSPSSFSLWAALARNEDQPVISSQNPPHAAYGWRWPQANFGRNWIWAQTPLLTADVVAKHGFQFKDYAVWVRWLETH